MLGSSIGKAAHASPQHGGGGPPAAYAAAAAAASATPGDARGGEEELDDHSGSCPPPMYNPRTAWAGDGRGLSSLQTSPPPAHASPTGESMGPRTTQDLLDLEEENRVLRREVTRLQQLNEARRKQLGDMQSRIDGLEGAERAQSEMSRRERERERETRRSASPPAQRRGGGGGGGGGGVTPPGSPRAQQQRLEAQVQRWKQKAFAQEERYSLLWNEVSRAGGDGGSAALAEALRTVASVGKTGLQEMADMEEAFDMVKGELRNARAALAVERERGGGGSSDGGDVAAVAYSAATSQTSPRDRRGRSGSPSGGGVCHQCAEHRFSIATLHDRLADVEADAAAKQRRLDEAVPSFPFLTALPGLESLEASLELALHGRDAALNLAVATSDYLDNYLHCIQSAPLRLPALPPAPAPTPSETPHHQPQDFPSSSAAGATATGGVAAASSHHQHPVPHPSLAAAADPPTLASSQRSGVGTALASAPVPMAPAAVPSAAASVAGAAHSVVASAGQYVSSSSLGGNGAALSASSSSGGAAGGGSGSVGGSPQQISAYVSGGSSVAQAVSAGMPPQAPPSSMRALESDAALDAADDDDMEQYAP